MEGSSNPGGLCEGRIRARAYQSTKNKYRGIWGAQSVEHLTLARVVILWFVGSSSASGSVLTAQSLEPDSDSVSPSLSVPLPPARSLSLSLSLSQK